MLNSLFKGIFTGSTTSITVPEFLLCIAVSLMIGVFFAFLYAYKSKSSQNFVVTLALLPAIVCVVIMMVNGNVGAGVAVAGAFSLVRFRSVPGTAKEIGMLFLAMGAGLISGMGYLGYAILFALVLGLAMFLFTQLGLGVKKQPVLDKTLRITIPEDLNYSEVFDDLLEKGKTNLGNYFKQDSTNIPEITFWHQRYYYYSKYDEGIQMDCECWWSVTPEIIAEYIAKLAGPDSVVIDGFCGSGGNVIQFSKFCKKIYAIDIDKPRLDICRNNCKVYNCKDNIEFILSDFLLMENSPTFINKADYIFLSPPWGGVKYKNTDVYSIKNLMTPSIYDIVRVSLNVSKKIMFYLPRTLLLEELFEIVSEILNKNTPGTGDRIFFDVHILKSANKIKAQLIIFGNEIGNSIHEEDLIEYLQFRYENIPERSLTILNTIAKIVGNFKFLQTETFIRKNYSCENEQDFPSSIIKYFFTKILSEQEKIKLKSLNIYKTFCNK